MTLNSFSSKGEESTDDLGTGKSIQDDKVLFINQSLLSIIDHRSSVNNLLSSIMIYNWSTIGQLHQKHWSSLTNECLYST